MGKTGIDIFMVGNLISLLKFPINYYLVANKETSKNFSF